eukprot:Hpha_TRINITY_DN16932_c1_g8::TRINITY_DN16932_c1_g8_i1::g.51605::m.51605
MLRHSRLGARLFQRGASSRGGVCRPRNVFVVQLRCHSEGEGVAKPKTDRGDAQAACERITKVGALVNVGLCGIKGCAGWVGGSSAMVADAVHSLGDLVGDGVTLAAIRYSRLPPDNKFPDGRGKYEALGTLCVSFLLVTTAAGIASYSWEAAQTVLAQESNIQDNLYLALGGGVISVFAKEILFHATKSAGERAQSDVTVANAWHHRSDAMSSVVAVAGIGGSMYGWHWLDPLAGGVVAVMIARTGIEIGWDSIGELADRSVELPDELFSEIQAVTSRRQGIREVVEIRARKSGPYHILYMHVLVDPIISVSEGARIERKLRRDILRRCEEVQSVFIRVSSQSDDAVPDISDKLREQVAAVLSAIPEIHGLSHFTAHFLGGSVSIHVEVNMDSSVKEIADARRIARQAEAAIVRQVPDVTHADVHLELRAPKRSFCELLTESESDLGQCPGGGGMCPPPRKTGTGGPRRSEVRSDV